MSTTDYGICFSSPILLPPRFLNLKAEIGLPPTPLPLLPCPLSFPSFLFPFDDTMHTSTPDTSPVGVHPSGANAVINGTPPETSPSSLTLDDEELTVRPWLSLLRCYLSLSAQKRTVHFTYAGQSITVRPPCREPLRRRSLYPPSVLVRNC